MKSHCDNCNWTGTPQITLATVPDLTQRLDPGGVVPSGECPQCHALCYPGPRKRDVHVAVVVEGGCVQSVYSDKSLDVDVIDLDGDFRKEGERKVHRLDFSKTFKMVWP